MVGKIEDFTGIRNQRRAELGEDDLNAFDRQIVGETCRLELPLTSVYNLRRVADLLRGLAERYDLLSRRDDIPPRSLLFEARANARATNAKLRGMRRRKGASEEGTG